MLFTIDKEYCIARTSEMCQSPHAVLIAITLAGTILLYGGTFTAYTWYTFTFELRDAYIEEAGAPLPAISNMFDEWPLISSCSCGIGSTLMFIGAVCIVAYRIPFHTTFYLRDQLVVLTAVAVPSVWISIASATDRSVPRSMGWIHILSTALFVAAAIASIYTVYLILVSFPKRFLKDVVAGSGSAQDTPLLGAAEDKHVHADKRLQLNALQTLQRLKWIRHFLIGACLGEIGVILSFVVKKVDRDAMWAFPLLAVSELSTLGFCALATFSAFYGYIAIHVSNMYEVK